MTVDESVTCENPACDKDDGGGPAQFVQFPSNKRYCSEECKREVKNTARRRQLVHDVVAAVSPTYELDEQELESQLNFLRSENKRLANAAEKYKHNHIESVEAIYQGVREGIASLKFDQPRTAAIKPYTREGREEICMPLLSDTQLSKVTPTYNTATCEERVELYAERIIELTELQRHHHPIRKCIVPVLGDCIEGDGQIFPSQAYLVDASVYRQMAVDGPRIFVNFFKRLLDVFEEVEVPWVIGNHGGLFRRSDSDPESNGDRILGRVVASLFEAMGEKRITFHIPEGKGERNWYYIIKEGNFSALCIHGDQIKGFSGLPWAGMSRKISLWASGGLIDNSSFTHVFMAHYHQLATVPVNSINVYCNGSTESSNTFAEEVVASVSRPGQWLLFMDPEKGRITSEYKVWLDHR